MSQRIAVAFAAFLLLCVPLVDASPKPAAYFLVDPEPPVAIPEPGPLPPPLFVPVGVPEPTLTGEGILEPYDPLVPNIPNGTRPSARLVMPASETVNPILFVTPANHSHPDRIKGSIILSLFPGPSAIANGNITVTLYEIPAQGAAVAFLNVSRALDVNASQVPNATAITSPNSTDPTVILYYELGLFSPFLFEPSMFAIVGPFDLNFTNGSRLGLGVRLTQGSSAAPMPVGASGTFEYDSLYTPALIVVPWYAPDVPKATTTKTTSGTLSGHPGGSLSGSQSQSGGPGGDSGSQGSPGVEFVALAALLALGAFVARRRMR